MRQEHKEEMKKRARNVRLTVAYDGTAYHGFQYQNPPVIAVQNVLEEVLRRGAETGAAAPALPLTDTVKRVEDGLAIETVDRASLMGVQTPQVFDADLIRAALQKAAEDGAAVTDDCSCVERMGMKVAMTAGSKENLKLTTPFDLLTARAVLEARGKGEL